MNVDLNNLRKQLVYTHDRLVNKLNSAIKDGHLVIDTEDIQSDMDYLRQEIAVIVFSYLPDNPELRDLSNEIDRLAIFNPDEENEEKEEKRKER